MNKFSNPTKKGKKRIHALVRTVRDLVNLPHRRPRLMRQAMLFSHVCSCMDAMEDSQLAIEAHFNGTDASWGAHYLSLFGLLQAFIIQQDAVMQISERLGHPLELPEALRDIRRWRNRAAGHVTKTDRAKDVPVAHHMINRNQLGRWGCELHSYVEGEEHPRVQDIKLADLERDQRAGIISLLTQLRGSLMDADRAHYAQFRGEPLVPLFTDAQNAFDARDASTLRSIVEGFRDAQARRDRQSDGVDHHVDEFLRFLDGHDVDGQYHLSMLIQCAGEIDFEYDRGTDQPNGSLVPDDFD